MKGLYVRKENNAKVDVVKSKPKMQQAPSTKKKYRVIKDDSIPRKPKSKIRARWQDLKRKINPYMENKYSPNTQAEIEKILTKFDTFKKFERSSKRRK